MAYVDEHGKEHCCEQCANDSNRLRPVHGLLLGTLAVATVTGLAIATTRLRSAKEDARRG